MLNVLPFPFAEMESLSCRRTLAQATSASQVPGGINELALSPGFSPKDIAIVPGVLRGQGVLGNTLGLLASLDLVMFGVLIRFTKIAFHSLGDR